MYSFHYPQKGGDFLKEVPRLYNSNYKKARRFKFLSLIKGNYISSEKSKELHSVNAASNVEKTITFLNPKLTSL